MITPYQLIALVTMMGLCLLGWKLGLLLKLPAAPILGPLIVVAAASALSVNLYMPTLLRSASSIGIGISIGCRFNLKLKRGMIVHLLVFLIIVLSASLMLGLVLKLFGLDTYTAMFAGMLGGITEISLIALEFDTVSYQVSLFHTVRMITLMLIVPLIARRIPPPEADNAEAVNTNTVTKKDWMVLILVSTAAGIICSMLKIPAGRMVGAMAASAVYSKKMNISPRMNKTLHCFLQCIVGGAIGLGVTAEAIAGIRNLIIPLLVTDALVLFECLTHAWIMNKIAGWDKLTSLLACTPGGLGPCVLLSVEMGANSSIVSMYQVIRYLSVILFSVVLGMFMKM